MLPKKTSRKRRILFAVKFLPDPSDPETYKSLDDIRKDLPRGKWLHSRVFEEVDSAVELQMTPTAFWLLDRNDQALLLARRRVRATIEAYEDHLNKPKLK